MLKCVNLTFHLSEVHTFLGKHDATNIPSLRDWIVYLMEKKLN